MLYLIGSLRNPKIPLIANDLRKEGWEIFDDWFSPGSTTDEEWMRHELIRGRKYSEALQGYHAKDVFEFDKLHLDRAQGCILALPAGKSAHLELGYMRGCGKPGWILMEGEPDRWDVMYQFATGIAMNLDELVSMMRKKGVK